MNLSNRFLLMSSQQDENLKERVIKNTNQSGPASAGGVVPSKTQILSIKFLIQMKPQIG